MWSSREVHRPVLGVHVNGWGMNLPHCWGLGTLGCWEPRRAFLVHGKGMRTPSCPWGEVGRWEGVLGISLPGERSCNAIIRGACEAPAPKSLCAGAGRPNRGRGTGALSQRRRRPLLTGAGRGQLSRKSWWGRMGSWGNGRDSDGNNH